MEWQSGTMDVGEVPTVNGKVVIDDTLPNTGSPGTTYSLEYSDDGSSWTSLGTVETGEVITERHRYWRALAKLTTNTDSAPAVQRIRIAFETSITFCLADNPVLGHPPLITRLPTLSSKITPLTGKASISALTIELLNEGNLATDMIAMGTFTIKMFQY